MTKSENRRPLKVRELALALTISKWLSNKKITPNQISVFSVIFSALAGICLLVYSNTGWNFKWALPLFAAAFIQCRLLCNLFDGMVAVEGGKGTKSGELFNDIPDRIADPLILVCAGYCAVDFELGQMLGWLAGILAVMTAYIRTLSASMGVPADFRGPMAKQHRMAVMTAACVLTSIDYLVWGTAYRVIFASLILICIGCIITVIRRIQYAYQFLENKND